MRSLFLFLMASASLLGHEFGEYAIRDLGTLNADYSVSLDINNKNQVLGLISVGDESNIFIWDETNGLQLINAPLGSKTLNDNGQVTGLTYKTNSNDNEYGLFIWDKTNGVDVVYTSNNFFSFSKLTKKNQILIKEFDSRLCKMTIYIWDQSKKNLRNISEEFSKRFSGDISRISPVLTNEGDIFIIAADQESGMSKTYKINGSNFIHITLGFDLNDGVAVLDMDKNGNKLVLVTTYINNIYNDILYFINESKSLKIKLKKFNKINEISIINGAPVQFGCAASILKFDIKNDPYYVPGPEIKKMIKKVDDFWCGDISYSHQNEYGLLAGTSETVFPDQMHAVLIYPKLELHK